MTIGGARFLLPAVGSIRQSIFPDRWVDVTNQSEVYESISVNKEAWWLERFNQRG